MKPDLRQLALALLALGILGAIAPSSLSPPEVAPLTLRAEATTLTTGPENATTTTAASNPTATSTTAAAATAPWPVSITVYPSDAEATITVTDASGATTGVGTLEAEATGEAQIEVEADGYRPETHTLAADSAPVEVYLDPLDQLVDRSMVFTTGAAPKQVAFTPDGSELWVTLLGGAGVEIFDPFTGEALGSIDLPQAGAVEVIFDSSGETAYVSQMETATVYEVDVDTRSVTRELVTEGSWTKVVVLSPDETRLWASNWVSNDVSEFDLASGEMVRRISTVPTPRGLATDPAGEKLYVAGYDAGDIEMIDLEDGEGTTIGHTGGAMRHLVADANTGRIYASDMAKDLILVIDPATDETSTLGSTDRLPNTIDISPDGRYLAVSNRGRNNPETYTLPGPQWGSVLLLDTRTGEILDAIVGGNQPTGLDISTDGRWLAYSDFLDNRVTIASLPPTDTLLAGNGGRAGTYRTELDK